MDRLRAIEVFREVLQQGSFSGAGEALALATSAVSRQVSELERWLGVKLLHRSTRSLSLTEAGRAYLPLLDNLIDGVRAIEHRAADEQSEIRGSVRVTAPNFLARNWLAPLLPEFLARHPEINLRLLVADRMVNLIEEGYDLALRVSHPADSRLIARPLRQMQLKLVASPQYLLQHGQPGEPSDLAAHNCLLDALGEHPRRWTFKSPRGEFSQSVQGQLLANDGELIRQLAVAGQGIAYLPDFLVAEDLAHGRLLELLPDAWQEPFSIALVYPENRYMNRALRALLDTLCDALERKT